MEFLDVGKLIKNLNPVNGCTIGCSYCYAKKINDRFHITPVWNKPQFVRERIKRIYTKKPHTYLMTSMSDFSDWKEKWRNEVFAAIEKNPHHAYLFLTKHPERISFTTDSESVWIGVTVTNESEKKRIVEMTEHIKAKNYFITFEPLFSDIGKLNLDKIGWIVIGSETGNRKGKIKAEKDWVLNIVKEAKKKHIPIFMKKYLYDIVGEENMLQELPKNFK